MSTAHPYAGKSAVLATLHKKGNLIAPEFAKILKMSVEEVAIDTDSLGTFSGEIERIGSAKEIALKKARLGMSATGAVRGLASEGSIGADFYIPFIQSDVELIAFVDDEIGIEVVESYRSTEIIAHAISIDSPVDLTDFLKLADFPRHKLIVRSTEKPIYFCKKEIDSEESLYAVISEGLQQTSSLTIESDLRAHCSPSRAKNIAKTAEKLALRLNQLCPECSSPGWGIVGFEKGLPCSECGEVAEEALKSEILGCARCSCTQKGKVLAEAIDPSRCNLCNP
ncbi:MAG: hypothetical protein RL130_1147 [Actinomycetota bacterium]